MTLFAYDPATASIVFSAAAGTWPNAPLALSNIVACLRCQLPTANDLGTGPRAVRSSHPLFENPVQLKPGEHDVFGTITAIDGTTFGVKKRDGTMISVSTANAAAAPLELDEPVQVVGRRGTKTSSTQAGYPVRGAAQKFGFRTGKNGTI